nr:MAG TPA: hypothetical protein [Bacteriophage sp.]
MGRRENTLHCWKKHPYLLRCFLESFLRNSNRNINLLQHRPQSHPLLRSPHRMVNRSALHRYPQKHQELFRTRNSLQKMNTQIEIMRYKLNMRQ